MQKITTKEPTDDMIEVAIKAVEAVFDWKEYLKESGIEVEKKEETSLTKEYKQVIEGSGYNWKYYKRYTKRLKKTQKEAGVVDFAVDSWLLAEFILK